MQCFLLFYFGINSQNTVIGMLYIHVPGALRIIIELDEFTEWICDKIIICMYFEIFFKKKTKYILNFQNI